MDISEIVDICKGNDLEIIISTRNNKIITVMRKQINNQFHYGQFAMPESEFDYKSRFYICLEKFKIYIREIIDSYKKHKELYEEEFDKEK